MRLLFASITLVISAISSAAAQQPGNTLAALTTAQYSREDSIRAVRNLFQKRTKGALGYTGSGGAVLTGAAVASVLQTSATSAGQRIDTRQDLLAGGAMLGYGLVQAGRFGPQQYAHIVTAYQQGEPLPPYVRRRLKPKFFRYRPF